MARMSVDDMIARDPRITMLATELKWTRRETLGCLVGEVWPICYDQRTWLISERVIDAAAGHSGFAAAMIECELASRDRSGKVLVRGAKERIKYLDHKTDAGRQGGLKSAESRRKTPKQSPSNGGSTPQAAGNPPVPPSASASVLDPPASPQGGFEAFADNVDSVLGGAAAKRAKPVRDRRADPKPPNPDHTPARLCWFEFWHRRSNGQEPTWNGQHAKALSDFLKQHGLDEFKRRVELLEKSRDQWHRTWDFAAFAKHSDRLVSASTSTTEQIRMVNQL